jgi:serine/threonine-protein kinase SRPK3
MELEASLSRFAGIDIIAEDPDAYRVGGLHPVHIYDEFGDGRYIVVRKLGFGFYSTVWLAYDRL